MTWMLLRRRMMHQNSRLFLVAPLCWTQMMTTAIAQNITKANNKKCSTVRSTSLMVPEGGNL
jgi:hypothetical protein